MKSMLLVESQNDVINLHALSLIDGIGPRSLEVILGRGVDPGALFEMDEASIRQLGFTSQITRSIIEGRRGKIKLACEIAEKCYKEGIRIIVKGTEDYPKLLAECADAPVALYVRGDAELNPKYSLSIVGTRAATAKGLNFCNNIISEIAQRAMNVTIVSGLALGIDAAAHRAALNNGLPTIAVMPGWVDNITPASHYSLARSILANKGAIISEMPPHAIITRGHYLSRNRIIAGLSWATIMAQSDSSGGAMATANIANGYDREVFTPPANSTDQLCAGNIALLKSNRANMLENLDDILMTMNWHSPKPPKELSSPDVIENLSPEQLKIYSLIPESEPFTIDQISYHAQMSVAQASATLTILELKGLVTTIKGRLYMKLN